MAVSKKSKAHGLPHLPMLVLPYTPPASEASLNILDCLACK